MKIPTIGEVVRKNNSNLAKITIVYGDPWKHSSYPMVKIEGVPEPILVKPANGSAYQWRQAEIANIS